MTDRGGQNNPWEKKIRKGKIKKTAESELSQFFGSVAAASSSFRPSVLESLEWRAGANKPKEIERGLMGRTRNRGSKYISWHSHLSELAFVFPAHEQAKKKELRGYGIHVKVILVKFHGKKTFKLSPSQEWRAEITRCRKRKEKPFKTSKSIENRSMLLKEAREEQRK